MWRSGRASLPRVRTIPALLLALSVTLVGCTSTVAGVGSPVPGRGDIGDSSLADDSSVPDGSVLVVAQYAECDHGVAILNYLATGDNGGDPGMDQLFAPYVGVSEPQARALASDWIEACNEEQAEQSAAAASSSAAAAASESAAAEEAAAMTENMRACESMGGRYVNNGVWDGACESTVVGNPSGQPFKDCGHAWLTFPATEDELAELATDYPGCFP
jgi:predicted small secreted protein